MTLPSAKPAGLPTAQSAPGSINSVDLCVEILKVSCPVALNLSELPDGRYRATALFSDAVYDKLIAWAKTHYRETLAPDDLRDPALMDESRAALDALTQILELGSGFYPFQRV